MGKRSNFTRRKSDAYDTPPEALAPLLPYLPKDAHYIEPCAGAGKLVDALVAAGYFVPWITDIEPRRADIGESDAKDFRRAYPQKYNYIIVTNPPWTREILHPLIETLRECAPTWLLIDAPWAHTKQAIPHLVYCQTIVSVGRVSWEQNKVSSLDDCAWFLFGRDPVTTEFVGRR